MHHIMSKFWWILALRGLLGVLLGISAILWILYLDQPKPDLFGLSYILGQMVIAASIVLLLGAYAFIDGAFAFLLGIQDYGNGRRWGSLVVEGLMSIGLGLLTWIKPHPAAIVLLYWTAAWALFTGFLEVLQGFEQHEYKDRRKLFLVAGTCSVVFGVLLAVGRDSGQALIWFMGAYAFLFGWPMLVLAFRLRHYWLANRGGQ